MGSRSLRFLIGCGLTTEHEINAGLKDQGVVGVRRVTVKKDGAVIHTGNTLILTFNKLEMPKLIPVGYLQVQVDLFVPNPLRCFGCNKFRHTSDHCKVAQNQCVGPQMCSKYKGPRASPLNLPSLAEGERDSACTR